MTSTFYKNGHYLSVAIQVKNYLNRQASFLSAETAKSPRAVGDALEIIIAESFSAFLGDFCREYSRDFARRAMADLAFLDSEEVYTAIDVKTHREDTSFNMPNLTSVERLSRFYESNNNVFALLMIRYKIEGLNVVVTEVKFAPIEFLDWSCLTIGALGWGQIQIKNSNRIEINDGYSRKEWMLQLCDLLIDNFYPGEILKIAKRKDRFESVKKNWLGQSELY